jgi:formamidopyrimidine-DNA glycosylase
MIAGGRLREVHKKEPNMRKQVKKALPHSRKGHRIEDVNKTARSLVVHPERIVVPLRTRNLGHSRVSRLV